VLIVPARVTISGIIWLISARVCAPPPASAFAETSFEAVLLSRRHTAVCRPSSAVFSSRESIAERDDSGLRPPLPDARGSNCPTFPIVIEQR